MEGPVATLLTAASTWYTDSGVDTSVRMPMTAAGADTLNSCPVGAHDASPVNATDVIWSYGWKPATWSVRFAIQLTVPCTVSTDTTLRPTMAVRCTPSPCVTAANTAEKLVTGAMFCV